MCISPSEVWVLRGPNWEAVPTACRQCWRCKQNRLNDYVGRAMAEFSTSAASCCISLTYAPRDDLADKVLQPRHFQLFIKMLRRAGHKVRYLVAGEYGELKGRAHFHALLFFEHIQPLPEGVTPPEFGSADAPFCREIPFKRMVHIREWPHGHISVDWSASERSARYVCKYLLSDDKNNAWFSLSKKPPLGAAWFAQKAASAVEYGVLPSSFEYLPPGGSKDRPYLMTGATRRDYMNAITINPARRVSMGEWVQKSFDKYERERFIDICAACPPEHVMARMAENCAERALSLSKVQARLLYENYLMDNSDFSSDVAAAIFGIENNDKAFEAFYRANPEHLRSFVASALAKQAVAAD